MEPFLNFFLMQLCENAVNALCISACAQSKIYIAHETVILAFCNISVSELVPGTCTGVCFILTPMKFGLKLLIELYLCITQIYC